jgi:non-specific serine/threonine protein kinase/serine/threonine-protein kinase
MTGQPGDDWLAVRRLFDELVDLKPSERTRRLAAAGEPPHIIERVRDLLDAASGEGILDKAMPVLARPADDGAQSSLSAGQMVGAFTVDRLIGRGGMGEVYLAHRTARDFEQRVALKMLRVEAADHSNLLERERRMLARLEHPGIARLIDGGIAPDGRPYMAMEYVDGAPIDRWCHDHQATLDQRLALFCDVCEAVAYAHANLVVHRDLKPSNILIDGAGKVRLLDFGIAKLLDDVVVAPAATQALLTPDHAAPEQLAGEASTVATDVYALGVILFELVVGHGPWRREEISIPSLIQRIMRGDPPLPSQAAGKADAPVPAGKLIGDIDAIVMKAMRRDPGQRYRSVGDLADDVRRHRALKPVRARGASRRYMAGRFVRRYRWAVGASAAMIAAILIGAGGIAWQARQTAIERDVALAEAHRADAVNRMLATTFREAGERGAGEDVTAKQMLDEAAVRLVTSIDKSAESAALVLAIAVLYIHVDDQRGAETLLDKALAAGIGREDAVATAEMQLKLASIKALANKVAESRRLLGAAAPVFSADPARFRTETIDVVVIRAIQARREGDPDAAIGLLTGILPEAAIVLKGDERELLRLHNMALSLLLQAKRLDAFPAMLKRTQDELKRTGQERGIQGINTLQYQGRYLLQTGDPAGAERILSQAVALRRNLYGESAALAGGIDFLGDAKLALGRRTEALGLFAEARTLARKYLGPTAEIVISTSLKLGRALSEAGDTAGAIAILNEIEPILASSGEYAMRYGDLFSLRAEISVQQGRIGEARAAFDRAETIFRAQGSSGEARLEALSRLRAGIARVG